MQSLSRLSASSAPANCKVDGVSTDSAVPVSRYLVFFSLAIGGCAADLLSKELVFAWRGLPRPQNEWWIWEPYVGIETAVNTGALAGIGDGYGRLFAVISVVAALGIVAWLFCYRAAHDRWLNFALGAVMGGVLGNLYDRMGLWFESGMDPAWQSGVRDWILLRYGEFTWPNFNIADSLLVCGAAMLMLHSFRDVRQQSSPNPE